VEVKTNDEGNRCIEQDRLGGDKMEISYMPNRKWPDHDVVQDVVRMRLKKASGGHKFGIEIPIDDVPEFVAAIVQLLSERAHTHR
jgi:hypothetical protein